ncbi:hypothetical protein PSA7680_03324 [Pseudoruegeria aquimaris]|uniref:Thiol:disulfide interchange protein DsbD N-terminal domain-containing protein n=1 Tax=Pseudoruegeria aquimaris TaxID=393663 RepID=A0A1Y5TFF8_9RHOB|nr:protein-disulfide reductase DsbD domain-containing protein [Pseudoruegeria aquimaris]SLN62983.1 hypothetical protein PSA7680_03324 [Pseudoruegeria aquimaris]
MSRRRSFLSLLCGLALAAVMQPVAGTAQVLAAGEAVEAEFLPGWRLETGEHMAGIRLRLAPGWKTYWRAPGDAGIPPRLTLGASQNIAGIATHWPRPEVTHQNGMRVIGYTGEVVFPLRLTPRDPNAPITLRGRLEIGVCEDVCLPVTLNIRGTMPPGGAPYPAIEAALSDQPMTARQAGVSGVACRIEPISDGLRVTAEIRMPPAGGEEITVFELRDPSIWISETKNARRGGTLTASAEMVAESGTPFVLDRSELRISVLGRDRMVDIRGCSAG